MKVKGKKELGRQVKRAAHEMADLGHTHRNKNTVTTKRTPSARRVSTSATPPPTEPDWVFRMSLTASSSDKGSSPKKQGCKQTQPRWDVTGTTKKPLKKPGQTQQETFLDINTDNEEQGDDKPVEKQCKQAKQDTCSDMLAVRKRKNQAQPDTYITHVTKTKSRKHTGTSQSNSSGKQGKAKVDTSILLRNQVPGCGGKMCFFFHYWWLLTIC
jgi:hypothetical protein